MKTAQITAAAMALAGSLASPRLLAQASSPFDPSGYIHETEKQNAEKAGKLLSRAIFRINGQRFQKFLSSEGAVYLPSSGETPEVHEEFALCPQHLKLMNEVLPMRENLIIEPALKKFEIQIVNLIRKCQEGRIKSPVAVQENPDGAVVEIKAKEAEPKPAPSVSEGK